jgi:hypothetical protein
MLTKSLVELIEEKAAIDLICNEITRSMKQDLFMECCRSVAAGFLLMIQSEFDWPRESVVSYLCFFLTNGGREYWVGLESLLPKDGWKKLYDYPLHT